MPAYSINEKALGLFVAAVERLVRGTPPIYHELLTAEGLHRRRLYRKCEAHFNSLPVEVRTNVQSEAAKKAHDLINNPFDRLANTLVSSLDQSDLECLFPKSDIR